LAGANLYRRDYRHSLLEALNRLFLLRCTWRVNVDHDSQVTIQANVTLT